MLASLAPMVLVGVTSVYDPASIAIDTCRSILITEVGGHCVSIFNKDGVAIHTLLWILWFC